MRRIGVLMAYGESDPEGQAWVATFREGLQKLGWRDPRDVDHAVQGLALEHVALLVELNKSNRGSPWTAISRFNRRSRVLMVGRPSAPSLDSSTRLSLALRRRSVGSLSCCREREIAREPRRPGATRRCR